jgi:hypothetical protein
VIRITTPKGIAVFPKVQVAERYDEAANKFFSCSDGNMVGGVYSTSLSIPVADCVDLCAQLDALAQEALADALSDPKKVAAAKAKRKTIELNAPYVPELDKENNETGNILFKFKSNASAQVNGALKIFAPPLVVDGQAKPITKNLNMYSGSIIKVSFSPTLYFTAASSTCGVSCRLNGVQVLKLQAGGYTAASLGFGAEEGGFDSSEGDVSAPVAEGGAPPDGAGTAAPDF